MFFWDAEFIVYFSGTYNFFSKYIWIENTKLFFIKKIETKKENYLYRKLKFCTVYYNYKSEKFIKMHHYLIYSIYSSEVMFYSRRKSMCTRRRLVKSTISLFRRWMFNLIRSEYFFLKEIDIKNTTSDVANKKRT